MPKHVFVLCCLLWGCEDQRSGSVGVADAGGSRDGATALDAGTGTTPSNPDRYWLDEIGTGLAQRMNVCAGGAKDPIALALCASDEPIDSLAKLYATLKLDGSIPRSIALGTNSSGLGARIVSAAILAFS